MTRKRSTTSSDRNVSIGGDVVDSVVISGDNNVVKKTTIIQKFFNIFKSDAETLEQRNRRILLGHVEYAWIKGVLDASLYGAAMLDLGIKETPEAITNKYPWTLKKESTNETLPAGTSMLEIFDSIGMGRSLLILGAPGSGKTTMLLELARQLIERARKDVTYPIPMVFNLASWTEKLTLADWLAQELNNLYSVPRKTAPDWVKGNKLLLLLDGLDEVRQESRAKCVEAINEFRKQNGLTSLSVCSRSQDYADLKAKLSFEGAIEVQPLTQGQIAEFFTRFGDEMAGIKHVLEKDSELREMAETPLFLSIIVLAYGDIPLGTFASEELDTIKVRRKHLFDTYIRKLFDRAAGTKNALYTLEQIKHWLYWLANNMKINSMVPYVLENMQSNWFDNTKQNLYRMMVWFLVFGLIFTPTGLLIGIFSGIHEVLLSGLFLGLSTIPTSETSHAGNKSFFSLKHFLFVFLLVLLYSLLFSMWRAFISEHPWGVLETGWVDWLYGNGLGSMMPFGLFLGLLCGFAGGLKVGFRGIEMIDTVSWGWRKGLRSGLIFGSIGGLIIGLSAWLSSIMYNLSGLWESLFSGLMLGLIAGLFFAPIFGFSGSSITKTTYPGQKITYTFRNFVFIFLFILIECVIIIGLIFSLNNDLKSGLFLGLIIGLIFGAIFSLRFGGLAFIQHYTLRLILARNNLLPWRLVPFLDHCVDMIFLRRVGGGYIFIHRLLMEHFAEMYEESPTSKGN